MDKLFFSLGAIFGGLAVAAGAFGAHSLKSVLTAQQLDTFEKAVRYQMYHALALLAVAWAIAHWPQQARLLALGGWLFVAGIVFFSGSLYALTLAGLRWMGMVTPLGGVAFAAGWLCLAVGAWRGG